ncbi:MAG: hypothetical protein MI861_22580, partial [Pirellulales bacterium]|nr:hypothetical protein [Pirellulales bacterium]
RPGHWRGKSLSELIFQDATSPYVEAVWENFDDERETWTEELVTGRLFEKAWNGIRGWWSDEAKESEKQESEKQQAER